MYHYEKLVFQRDGRWHALLIITTRGDGTNRIVDFGHFRDEMAARTALKTGIALHRRDLKYRTDQFDQYVKSLFTHTGGPSPFPLGKCRGISRCMILSSREAGKKA